MTEPNGHCAVSAIILAAGTSSRMGIQKQLLRIGSKTLLQHTLESVQASQVDEIVLVLGSAAHEIRQHLDCKSNVKVVINPAFDEGMGSSLKRGLAELNAQCAATLVVLADQPLVKPATLNQLIDEYRRHKPQILIPLYRGFRGNPVLLDRSVFPEISGLNGDTGCRAIFGDHLENICKLEVDDAGILLDADRPQDLESLNQIYSKGSFGIAPFETAATSFPASPDLVVVGRESVATAIVKFAHLLNFRVTVVDPLLTLQEMPEATAVLRDMNFGLLPESARQFCVVASMGRFDEEAIEQALALGIPYLALVANKKRSQEVLQSLGFGGLSADKLALVRTKPGISIGAQTPAEIALSIVAEIVAEIRKK